MSFFAGVGLASRTTILSAILFTGIAGATSMADPIADALRSVLGEFRTYPGDKAIKIYPSDQTEGQNIVDFEFAISTPFRSETLAWSPDGKRLAMDRSASGLTYGGPAGMTVFDPKQRKFVANLDTFKGALGVYGWSPDGKYIAISGRHVLILISSDDLKEIATWNKLGNRPGVNEVAGCPRLDKLVFEKDGKSLWIVCTGIRTFGEELTLARKLSVPDLQIVDQITVPVPVRGNYYTSVDFADFIERDGKLYLGTIIGSLERKHHEDPATERRNFVSVHSLEKKKRLSNLVFSRTARREPYDFPRE